ncbi:MAG: hypothetical protein N2037_01950 [Acidimicrobiales bacterium]|nr:hypothetical protein [Acidimicrobiales bacterium]
MLDRAAQGNWKHLPISLPQPLEVRVLVEGGAAPDIGAAPSGHSPVQAAEAPGHREIVALLAGAA